MVDPQNTLESDGTLYVVATPIGNLADMSRRAIDVLAGVSLIAAEDTRHTRQLLAHFGIHTPLCAYHDHNEDTMAPSLLGRLAAGETIALVADAGTPLISDPGYTLVERARAAGHRVVPIPGCNAAICALSAAGLPTDRFLFLGFPPRVSAKRREWLAKVAAEPGTLVLYEAATRAIQTLSDIGAVLGETRRTVVARELTKRFEQFLDGTADALARHLEAHPDNCRGEFVILVEGEHGGNEARNAEEEARILKILMAELPIGQAASLAARISGGKRNRLYQLALSWQAD